MKITRIETIPLAIPHDHGGPPPAWGGQAWEGLSILLVRVETEDGATGWGEAFSYNCMPAVQAVVDATVAPILIGRDATDIASLNRELQQALHLFGRYGITMFGISAVDIALWDLAGKRAGLPLGQLLGGPAIPPLVPGYASLLKYRDRELVAETVRAALDAVAKARAADATEFDPETRVYFLGLAPNAARLSVRFWQPVTFGEFARHITRFWDDLALAPSPWKTAPAAWSLLYETALQRKVENIPPRLGGDLMRAVLTGAPYPRTLLSGVINRIRADGDINGRRAAICRAVINQNTKREEIPMSLDRDNPNPAYRLGRMFAVLESIQQAALPGLNATIRDRYFASASATPARIFPQLTKIATHHLSLLRKGDSGGLAHWLDREMGDIWGGLEADLQRALNLEDQGRFVAGYYHQRWTKKTTEGTDAPQDDVIETGSIEQ